LGRALRAHRLETLGAQVAIELPFGVVERSCEMRDERRRLSLRIAARTQLAHDMRAGRNEPGERILGRFGRTAPPREQPFAAAVARRAKLQCLETLDAVRRERVMAGVCASRQYEPLAGLRLHDRVGALRAPMPFNLG